MKANNTFFSRQEVINLLKQRQGGMTLSELAEKVGVSQQFLSMIYLGKRDPGNAVLDFLGLEQRTVYFRR